MTIRKAEEGMSWRGVWRQISENRIALGGVGFLVMTILVTVLLRNWAYPDVPLSDVIMPHEGMVAVLRPLGVAVTFAFVLYGQVMYSRLLRTQNSLKHAERRNRDLITVSPDPLIVCDTQGKVLMANDKAALLWKFGNAADLEGQIGRDLIPPEDRDLVEKNFDKLLHGEPIHGLHFNVLTRDDVRVPVEANASLIYDVTGSVEGFMAACRDVTERRHLERQIIEIGERERRRIGVDLHDSVCSELAGIHLYLESLRQTVAKRLPELNAQVEEISKLLRTCIAETRMLAHGLSSVSVEEGEIISAMEGLCQVTQTRSGVTCSFLHDDVVDLKDPSVATHLYRIAQESISNAVTHGKPAHIEVHLVDDEESILLVVKDDGIGLPNASHQTGGSGIATMRYRCSLIGASFRIDPGSEGGTIVHCSVPKMPTTG